MKNNIPLDSNHGIAEKGRLYGMCYLLEERAPSSRKPQTVVKLMKNMGVKSIRHWLNFNSFMTGPKTLKADKSEANAMHEFLALCAESGIMNVGMNHHNYCTTRKKASTHSKPFARDINNWEYVQWLNDYYDSWYTLVTEFPELEYWEIDNEVNNVDFMTESAIKGKSSYNVEQMAEIAVDMFYYASRAIHDANPNAKTVMGGLTEPEGLGRGNLREFFQIFYDKIFSGDFGYFYGKEDKKNASTDPDDYFEIACWHPYMGNFNKQEFIRINNEYYEILLRNEKKHKRVLFTEIGWNDEWSLGEDLVNDFMGQMLEACATFPWLESVMPFKLYDDGTLGNWDGEGYIYFGFFRDADPTHKYTPWKGEKNPSAIDENGFCIPGAPKRRANVFQRVAKGEGDLEILMKEIQKTR